MDAPDRKAALIGRVALLIAAFGCAVAASVAYGTAALGLMLLAGVIAAVACLRPAAVSLGRIIKPH